MPRPRWRLVLVPVLVTTAAACTGDVGTRTIGDRVPTTNGRLESTSPVPSIGLSKPTFPGIWPEATAEDLEDARAEVDEGRHQWRLDPLTTATAFAVAVLGWAPDDVESSVRRQSGPRSVVAISNGDADLARRYPGALPITDVRLARLDGRIGASIWSVVRADSRVIRLQDVTIAHGVVLDVMAASAMELDRWWIRRFELWDEAPYQSKVKGRSGVGMMFPHVWTSLHPFPDGTMTLVVKMPGPKGVWLAVDAVPIAVTDLR